MKNSRTLTKWLLVAISFLSTKYVYADVITDQLRIQSQEINKTLPAILDDETELLTTNVSGERLVTYIYRFRTNWAEKVGVTVFTLAIKKNNENIICTLPDTKNLVQQGVEFKSIYLKKDSTYFTETLVNKKTCQNSKK